MKQATFDTILYRALRDLAPTGDKARKIVVEGQDEQLAKNRRDIDLYRDQIEKLEAKVARLSKKASTNPHAGTIHATVGDILRPAMKAAGMTHGRLAELTGLHRVTVSKIVSGARPITASAAVELDITLRGEGKIAADLIATQSALDGKPRWNPEPAKPVAKPAPASDLADWCMPPNEMRTRLAILGALIIDRDILTGKNFELADKAIGYTDYIMFKMFREFMKPNPLGDEYDTVVDLPKIRAWLKANDPETPPKPRRKPAEGEAKPATPTDTPEAPQAPTEPVAKDTTPEAEGDEDDTNPDDIETLWTLDINDGLSFRMVHRPYFSLFSLEQGCHERDSLGRLGWEVDDEFEGDSPHAAVSTAIHDGGDAKRHKAVLWAKVGGEDPDPTPAPTKPARKTTAEKVAERVLGLLTAEGKPVGWSVLREDLLKTDLVSRNTASRYLNEGIDLLGGKIETVDIPMSMEWGDKGLRENKNGISDSWLYRTHWQLVSKDATPQPS